MVKGLDSVPASERPTYAEANIVHLAWDVMVGMATLLFLLAAWYALSWLFRRDNPKLKLFWWLAAAAGVGSILALEAGWVVTEVGRQPWIVFDYYKVKQAATPNQGVWATFLIIAVLYVGVGVTLVLILRHMSRRWREQPAPRHRNRRAVRPARTDPGRPGRGRAGAGRMTDAVAVVLMVGIVAYAVFGGADFGAGFWDLTAGGAARGERPAPSSPIRSGRSGKPTTSGSSSHWSSSGPASRRRSHRSPRRCTCRSPSPRSASCSAVRASRSAKR